MPVLIDGVTYFSATEVCAELSLARQTLWRWRTAERIPGGRRYRDHQLLFTLAERAMIANFAKRLGPELSKAAPAAIGAKRRKRRTR